MTKYIFLNMPAYGHVNPTLAIAQELVQRGQEVIYYLPDEFQAAVQATGAAFRGYDSKMSNISPPAFVGTTGARMQAGPMPAMMVDEGRHVLPQVFERIRAEQADYIIYEPMSVWSRIVVRALQLPAISLYPSYAMNEHFNLFSMMAQQQSQMGAYWKAMMEQMSKGIAELCEAYHVAPFDMRSLQMDAELAIVFIPRAFQPASETFDERYVFVGPSISPRPEESHFPFDQLRTDLLYISLGTVFNNQPEFFKMCFEAFGGQQQQVILSHGKHVNPAELGSIPENFLLSSYVPQLAILQRARVFISHCGMNSTMESLYYGVPIVGIPQMPEQQANARRVAEMGLGVMLERNAVTAEALRETVTHVMNDAPIHENLKKMQQITREAGGYQHAADAIMQLNTKHAH